MSKVTDFSDAIKLVKSSSTLAVLGVIGWAVPDKLLKALGDQFHATGYPRDLTIFSPVYAGDNANIKGIDHIILEGLARRIIIGNYINPPDPITGERPQTMQMIKANKVEAYSFHIGAIVQWMREIARRGPGYLTEIGIGTFVDPDFGGGKLTPRTKEDLVKKIKFQGKDHLFFPCINLDCAFIRATSSDQHGNLSFEDDPLTSSALVMAMAVKTCGGTVIAQVKNIVEVGSRPAHMVKVPGAFVDKVVVDPDQWMVTDIIQDQSFLGQNRISPSKLPPMLMGAQKVIARRAAQLIRKEELTIYGFGASSSIPSILAETGALDGQGIYEYPSTTEHGSYGGIVAGGWQFSANINPDSLIDGVSQFDAIHGGLCKTAALAFAQFDLTGNINVSKFANANPGSGGFIDIATNAQRLIFTGTFTTGGLKVKTSKEGLKIIQEGRVSKFVKSAEQITYPLLHGVIERDQKAIIVTERAVFNVVPDGLELCEIAPGIDLQRDILDLMEFPPVRIAEPLVLMATKLFV